MKKENRVQKGNSKNPVKKQSESVRGKASVKPAPEFSPGERTLNGIYAYLNLAGSEGVTKTELRGNLLYKRECDRILPRLVADGILETLDNGQRVRVRNSRVGPAPRAVIPTESIIPPAMFRLDDVISKAMALLQSQGLELCQLRTETWSDKLAGDFSAGLMNLGYDLAVELRETFDQAWDELRPAKGGGK